MSKQYKIAITVVYSKSLANQDTTAVIRFILNPVINTFYI